MTQSQKPEESGKPSPEKVWTLISPRPCVMVIDDDSAIRAMLQTALEKDYSIVCFSNGDQVLRSIDIYAPRLLVLDINMPGSDGYDICRRVRTRAKSKKLPVLFMTIRKDDATFLKTLASGGDAVICKPFEIAALRERIAYLLGSYPAP